ncbi:MAG: hypothetical protein ACREQ5_28705, partial [Candidatus Dormibacteria bacterium]
PTTDQPEPGDHPDQPGQPGNGTDTNGKPEATEPGSEQPDGADGPGGHADPPGTIDHQAGPNEQ